MGEWRLEQMTCSDGSLNHDINARLDWEFLSEYGTLQILDNSFILNVFLPHSSHCFIEIQGDPHFSDSEILLENTVASEARGCTDLDRGIPSTSSTALGTLQLPFQLKIENGVTRLYITDTKTRSNCSGASQVLVYKRQDLLF